MGGRWGLTYPLQGIPLAEHGPILREAEELGYTDAWSAEVESNDAFTPLAAFAAWTEKTRLGCAIASVYNRTPTLLAQTAAAIEELAPGRFCLGIGTSSPAIVERWNGVPLAQPMTRMRDTIAFLREAWSGEKVVRKVGPYDVKGFRLGRAPEPPPKIFVAALREQMLRLAGELGDGAITNYISPDDAPRIAKIARDAAAGAGKNGDDFDVACRIFVIWTEDRQLAQMMGRFMVSGYLTTPFYYAFHEWLGRGEMLAPMMKAWQARDRQEAVALVPEKVVDDIFVFGSPDECKDKIEAYRNNGISTPVINIIPTARDRETQAQQSLEAFRALAPR
ncbi:MAG: LLM class F420-dependent oxidoreductase [Chloroflexi bacterium]|nr:LLM class F420-dependent oxidoreductase [Chloroflexota bacterium]MCI0783094.1 LLM class F420-dependent oxidoreductase [Chloroflexota bacterium]MCI0814283.1 LLM class F420-dependent oxidoreductase [Chloroflexota bacterium]MCI0817133.1 LLM class F420-dependent oxidoreductase [Chloroflexota bacterium]MCI0820445.1 LLM class F420-dependent oxidoreductase [Chloroflexota bacterium]